MSISRIRQFLLFLGVGCLCYCGVRADQASNLQPRISDILKTTGIKGGLIVHVGCGDGKLTVALHANDSFLVHGLDTDVTAARKHIQSLGLYGPVSVEQWTGDRLPYTDNLVNLVVADNLGKLPMREVLRVLVPNGVALVGGKKTVKPRPNDIDEWTHWLHGPDNNPVARDTRLATPRRMQWCCEPLWSRSHAFTSSTCAMVSGQGRLFYILDEGPIGVAQESVPEKWMLTARDAFNGVLLWKRPLSPWGASAWKNSALRAAPIPSRECLVAENDRVYVTLGYESAVSILDAATGADLAVCEGSDGAQQIRCVQGVLLVNKGGKELLAFDAQTGRRLWGVDAKIRPLSLAASGERLFFHDQKKQAVVCLRVADGKPTWETPCQQFVTLLAPGERVVLVNGNEMRAIAADTGQTLWRVKQAVRAGNVFVARQTIWLLGNEDVHARDLLTGEMKTQIDTSDVYSAGHHHRCYPSKATESFLITQNRGAEFISLTGGEHTQNDWIRGACTVGIMPCNGLLYLPPHPCFCYPGVKLTGFNVLAPAGTEPEHSPPSGERLERGPAFGDSSDLKYPTSNSDWPTYRHDASRSGATGAEVSPQLVPLWQAAFHGPLSPPVVCDGRLCVAAKNEYTLFALDAESGRRLWQFTAGGRIDSPPTADGSRILFGCANGFAYCLRASDGALVWRFRAAPEDERIIVDGQLESPWRVHGSVLLLDGVAYLTAGRSSFLDGGIWIYGLDVRSGQVRYQTCLDTWERLRDDAKGKPFYPSFHIEGATSDILVSQDGFLYLGQFKFDAKLVRQEVPYLMPAPNQKPAVVAKPTNAAKVPRKMTPEFRENPFDVYMEGSHPGLLAQYQKAFGGLTFGERRMGLHLMPISGFLDDSAFNRTYWTYSDVRPGSDYNRNDRDPRSGELLVTSQDRTYVVRGHPAHAATTTFAPGKDGCLLAALINQSPSDGRDTLVHASRRPVTKTEVPPLWSDQVPLRIRSMVLAGKTLFVAGPPDVIDPADPMAAFEGRKGGVLRAYSTTYGKKLSELKLNAPPVFDGLIAADSRLFLSTTDGKIVCLSSQ